MIPTYGSRSVMLVELEERDIKGASMEERHELDEITKLTAVAMGVPGNRTFFLILERKGEWIRAWLEKELLEALALAIDQLLSTLARENLYHPYSKPRAH